MSPVLPSKRRKLTRDGEAKLVRELVKELLEQRALARARRAYRRAAATRSFPFFQSANIHKRAKERSRSKRCSHVPQMMTGRIRAATLIFGAVRGKVREKSTTRWNEEIL